MNLMKRQSKKTAPSWDAKHNLLKPKRKTKRSLAAKRMWARRKAEKAQFVHQEYAIPTGITREQAKRLLNPAPDTTVVAAEADFFKANGVPPQEPFHTRPYLDAIRYLAIALEAARNDPDLAG